MPLTARTPAEISIVIPAVNGWADLDRCLSAIDGERASTAIEAIVPERCGEEVRGLAARKFPWARIIPVSAETTIPQMRAAGIREARSPTVAIVEDHTIVRPGWARDMVEARTDETRVVGGGLVNAATDSIVDWAAWLCEYSHLAGPAPVGVVDSMHGNHTAYDRQLLEEHRDIVESGKWEDALHSAIQRKGVTLWSRPDIVAGHEKHYSVGEYTSQRFLYSRAYAAMRTSGATGLRKFVYGLLAFTLPPILLYRIVNRVWRGRLYRSHLLPSLPLLVIFVVSWALGEIAGAWFGDGGALAKVA